MEIKLTKGYVAHVDPCDFDRINAKGWYAKECFGVNGTLYAVKAVRSVRTANGWKRIWMHKEILETAEQVDHRDGDGLNNTRLNLRPASHSQNMGNRRKLKLCTSMFKGVYWYRKTNRWAAAVRCQKQRYRLGYFSNEIDAARAYNEAAIRLHGEFARINEIPA